MKIIYSILATTLWVFLISILTISCSTNKANYMTLTNEVAFEKSGAQLWGETCNRCHLAPSPSAYNDTDWETIGLHMRVRANLTEKEVKKIITFLKMAN